MDIISYKIVSTEPMTVRECVTGQGGLCGAVFVDDAFARLLELKMGKASWDKMTSTSRQRILNDDWEHGIKKQFLGQERTWTIQYPFECIDSHERKSLKRWPKIELDADDMCGVFRPVMNKIHDLIENQIEKVTKSEHKAPKVSVTFGFSALFGAITFFKAIDSLTLLSDGVTDVNPLVCHLGWWIWTMQISL